MFLPTEKKMGTFWGTKVGTSEAAANIFPFYVPHFVPVLGRNEINVPTFIPPNGKKMFPALEHVREQKGEHLFPVLELY